MSVEEFDRLKRKVKDLCVLIHTEQLDESDCEPQESLNDLLALSPDEMLDYAKATVTALLLRETGEVDSSSFKGYQKALQKLEAEVRSHITVSDT